MKAFGIKYDQAHYRRLEAIYIKKINQLYLSAIREAVIIAELLAIGYNPDTIFEFDKFQWTKSRVDKLFKTLEKNILYTISYATSKEWDAASKKNDDLVDRVLRSTTFKKEQVEHLYNRNLEALAAFQNRKVRGLNLSDRVWRYTNQFKGEIELGLDIGLSEGKSAAAMSRDLRQYLQNPDKLFRRVRDSRGELVLSKNAKKYHPGPGVYRSSYKNALRLTRTEVNMAYRESDYERWQQLDFIVGFEVRRSNRVFDCALCDALKGKYPKDFLFKGWHPSCRCYAVSIMSTIEEFIEREKAFMDGRDPGALKSINEVRNVPENYSKWITNNQDRIENAKSKPYFITDNLKYSGEKLQGRFSS